MQGVGLVDLLGICKGVSPNSHLEGTGRVPFGGGRVWGRGQRRRQCTHRLVLGGRDRRVTGHRLGTLKGPTGICRMENGRENGHRDLHTVDRGPFGEVFFDGRLGG